MKDGGADIDKFFDALAHVRRRLVLLYLNEHDTADLESLATFIAAHEGVDTDDEQVEQIRVDVHHCQLPKLANHGLISYDTRTNVARLEPVPAAVEQILDLTQDLENVDNS